jgi:hypothetical protein
MKTPTNHHGLIRDAHKRTLKKMGIILSIKKIKRKPPWSSKVLLNRKE